MRSIYETSDYTDALIKKGMLEQAGFLVYVDNLNAGGVMPHMGAALGYIIQVSDSDAEEAAQFLEVPYNPDTEDTPKENIDTCPKCGGWQIVRYRSPFWLPLHFILDVLMPAPGGRYRKCMACEHTYKTPGSDLSLPLKIVLIGVIFYLALLFLAPD